MQVLAFVMAATAAQPLGTLKPVGPAQALPGGAEARVFSDSLLMSGGELVVGMTDLHYKGFVHVRGVGGWDAPIEVPQASVPGTAGQGLVQAVQIAELKKGQFTAFVNYFGTNSGIYKAHTYDIARRALVDSKDLDNWTAFANNRNFGNPVNILQTEKYFALIPGQQALVAYYALDDLETTLLEADLPHDSVWFSQSFSAFSLPGRNGTINALTVDAATDMAKAHVFDFDGKTLTKIGTQAISTASDALLQLSTKGVGSFMCAISCNDVAVLLAVIRVAGPVGSETLSLSGGATYHELAHGLSAAYLPHSPPPGQFALVTTDGTVAQVLRVLTHQLALVASTNVTIPNHPRVLEPILSAYNQSCFYEYTTPNEDTLEEQ
eukprot:gene4423-6852_t